MISRNFFSTLIPSQMVFNIGRLLEERPSFVPEESNLAGFLDLLLHIMQNPSLHASIPALHLWVKLLSSDKMGNHHAIMVLSGDLLDTCSQRLVRFESLPENSDNPSIIFLNGDVDTTPEKHAFLGNYARFCNQIIELVVQKQPVDALYHILGQADQVLDHLYDGEPAFQRRNAFRKRLHKEAYNTQLPYTPRPQLLFYALTHNSQSLRLH